MFVLVPTFSPSSSSSRVSITRDRNGFKERKLYNRFRISWKDIFRYQIYQIVQRYKQNHSFVHHFWLAMFQMPSYQQRGELNNERQWRPHRGGIWGRCPPPPRLMAPPPPCFMAPTPPPPPHTHTHTHSDTCKRMHAYASSIN